MSGRENKLVQAEKLVLTKWSGGYPEDKGSLAWACSSYYSALVAHSGMG